MEKEKTEEKKNKNITEMTVIELKALAYDQISILEQAQNNLKNINSEIKKRLSG